MQFLWPPLIMISDFLSWSPLSFWNSHHVKGGVKKQGILTKSPLMFQAHPKILRSGLLDPLRNRKRYGSRTIGTANIMHESTSIPCSKIIPKSFLYHPCCAVQKKLIRCCFFETPITHSKLQMAGGWDSSPLATARPTMAATSREIFSYWNSHESSLSSGSIIWGLEVTRTWRMGIYLGVCVYI